jgi:hypothetical protein
MDSPLPACSFRYLAAPIAVGPQELISGVGGFSAERIPRMDRIHRPVPNSAILAGQEAETALRMAEAVRNFLDTLTAEERKRIVFPVESEERKNWHYVPRERKGIPWREMNGAQRALAHALVAGGLSRTGYTKAMSIMALESILKQIEGAASRFERDPDLYYITLFGIPSEETAWGWRLEGHHISINFLVAPGNRVACTPNFFGANPAEVPSGYPLADLRVLSTEEDLARRLLDSLTDVQLGTAVIGTDAPPDILTRADAHVRPEKPAGLPASDMNAAQQELLTHLFSDYLNRMPEDVAAGRMDRVEKEGKKYIHFAWAGSRERKSPHYYRVHGPSFLIEYDNTQNNANHIHSVWRDLRDDWGEDLLKNHYKESHSRG